MEMQPKTIPVSAEQGEWKMEEIIRVVKIDFSQLPEEVLNEVFGGEDGAIQWISSQR
jgi:hypothetical protein